MCVCVCVCQCLCLCVCEEIQDLQVFNEPDLQKKFLTKITLLFISENKRQSSVSRCFRVFPGVQRGFQGVSRGVQRGFQGVSRGVQRFSGGFQRCT